MRTSLQSTSFVVTSVSWPYDNINFKSTLFTELTLDNMSHHQQ
jgi:hypothetical protein